MACPGETVTYICTVNQGVQLDWIVQPFILLSERIQFTSIDTIGRSFDCSDVAAVNCTDLDFVATLTDVANPTASIADITSTLTFTAAVTLNGTVVQCRGATANGLPIANSSLNVAGVCVHVCSIVWCCFARPSM